MHTALDKAVLFHEQQCTFSACIGHDARAELAALRQRVAELEAVIALNKYVIPPFELTDDATVELAVKLAELERDNAQLLVIDGDNATASINRLYAACERGDIGQHFAPDIQAIRAVVLEQSDTLKP
ncbi:MAG: hypothetical protein IPO08_20495 [Xanthomonadales bacterium]|nr:hypothetical protein [Xanthomonadales bacterium]